MKTLKKLSLLTVALAIPAISMASTPQSWVNATPKISVISDQDASQYKVKFGYSQYDECTLSDGTPFRCKTVSETSIFPLTHADKVNVLLALDNASHLEISTLVIYKTQVGDLQNCDILNYNIGGKSSVVITVDKMGCQVS